jgi:16S rRNA (cytosine967-C5)-methyltransferase
VSGRAPRTPGRPRGESASPARVAAARALLAVEDGAHLEDALAAALPPRGEGEAPDRELAWFLAYGVERRRGHVDAALRAHLTRPIGSLDPIVRVVLRVGAFEALFARTRAHAVVHQAVEVARALGAGRAHGLVNAVLRRVAPVELGRAERLDHPAWLVARWDDRYGPEATERWCLANGEVPPLFLVGAPDAPAPADGEPAAIAGRAVPQVWRVPSQDPARRPDFHRYWVQDAAAVAVADLVGARPGERVLDACAAPGGKTLRLVSQGADVTAVDRDPDRLRRVEEGLARLTLAGRAKTRVVDWTGRTPDPGGFDAVLVDAPCTGLGTVRRHPEIRWRRAELDLAPASALQGRILTAASAHVRPGGRLVYAVCSPEPEEGEEVVAGFLAANREFRREATLSTAPPAGGEDAHWAARLVREG